MICLRQQAGNGAGTVPHRIAIMSRWLLALAVLLPPFAQLAFANPMVHQQGATIVDGQRKPLKLRGVLLEGWLMWNGTLWGAGLVSETAISKKLTELVGKEEALRFRTQIYDEFITERDIELIAGMGMNVVRVPFNHTLLEDDERPFEYKESGWARIDRLLSWCEKYGVYVVLDLHSAPGGQSGVFVNDPDGSGFYESEINIRRTVALWKAIADRYSDNRIIAGYDLLNEPQLPLFTPGQKLVDIYIQIVRAIREVDTEHMVILSGAGIASDDLGMFTSKVDSNQALAFHTYNLLGSDIAESRHRQFAKLSRELQVPIWNGEIGAHTIEWVTAVIAMFEDPEYNVSGWVFWPWKRVPETGKRYRHLMEISSTPQWDAVRKWLSGAWFAPKPTRKEALRGMQEFIESLRADRLIADTEMVEVVAPSDSR